VIIAALVLVRDPALAMKVVVDHLRGSRRGQRQEFVGLERIRFGRHPDNEVSFNAQRDLDASSRHGELRHSGAGYLLSDVGSCNGTRVAGEVTAEMFLERGRAVQVEFGATGPLVQLWVGDERDEPPPPPEEPHPQQSALAGARTLIRAIAEHLARLRSARARIGLLGLAALLCAVLLGALLLNR
jgi:hypothetical protein